MFYSYFGFDSALKTIDAHMFFWSVFLMKTHKKKLLTINNAILAGFLKLKQKKNVKKIFLMVFISKLKNVLFWGVNQFIQIFFLQF